MGRVAKYKKVKSFDPYSKKNRGNIDLPSVGVVWGLGDNGRRKKKRSLKAEKLHAKKNRNKKHKKGYDDGGFDMPPNEADEFDVADLMGSVKRQKIETKNLLGTDTVSNIKNAKKSNKEPSKEDTNFEEKAAETSRYRNTDDDELKVAQMLRLDKQLEKKAEKERQSSHGRMEGESKRAYAKRTRAETRQIIKNSTSTVRNVEKLQKKKEFLKNKKKKKKGMIASAADFEVDQMEPLDKDFSAPSESMFGEQADRPPIFRQVPRGAQKSKRNTTAVVRTQGMTERQVEAEKDAMEMMRRRIQAQYRNIRSQRNQKDGFHL